MARVIKLQIVGMHCGHCAERLVTSLGRPNGVIRAEVDPSGTATVRYDEARLSQRDLAERVREAGFDIP
ncbi:MAG: heavy-metal-associated domain-containing protein [Nitriliruptorales bacterium]